MSGTIYFKSKLQTTLFPFQNNSQSDNFSKILKSSVIIFQSLFFFMPSWLVFTGTVNWRSPHITFLIHSTLTSVLPVEGLPLRESSFISLQHSLNLEYNSKTHVHDVMLSPYTCWNISNVCGGVFLNQNFLFYWFLSDHSRMTWKRGLNKKLR